jgi:dihydroorotate dehydrogenase electron transfer subunit
MNYPKITSITETKIEAKNTKTIKFIFPGKIEPGQFFMIWIPNVDEIPMSTSFIDKKIKGITFRKIGDATNALYNLKKGDKIGIRGPYGNGFKLNGKNILFVGGGTGIATITPAIEQAMKNKISSNVILGVKTKNELFYEERIKNLGANVFVCTDDGSKGYKGLATKFAEELISKNNYDSVITCGPEIMMKKLFDKSKKIDFQASLERYMKCGFGLCGQCCAGEGLRVCKEGPVFNRQKLKTIKEFGIYERDASGRKIKL